MRRFVRSWGQSFTLLVILLPCAIRADVVIQTHHLVDFTVSGSMCSMDIDVSDMSVNLSGSNCTAIKGVDPPGAAFLFDYEFEVCDNSISGSSNLSMQVCPVGAGMCVHVAATSTGVAETPGCSTISGPVSVAIDPVATRIVLLHTDTDESTATRALAVRLFWLTGGPTFYDGFENGDYVQWSQWFP